ncbi:hypothetical protein R1sor_005584 [Riccia sorocarpa]|uniref:GPI ethanolamine phosphate transferase 3 n=1 Tax=Riccia sorocarpa TaxID=122646 RepID=A0ABD3HKL7_9MARC
MTLSLATRAFSLFVYLLLLDGVAIFFFTRGFLLTRSELSAFSNCSDVSGISSCSVKTFECLSQECKMNDNKEEKSASGPIIQKQDTPHMDEVADSGTASPSDHKVEKSNGQCWTRPTIKKAIVLIVDALRFDFVAHSRNFRGDPKPWMDKLPVLQRLVAEDNSTARIFKFLADPPTTTLQRLKGLTTGGLPTFIDIGHSFGAPAIVEDNLLLQLQRTGKRVVMMGDDTWLQLFPTQFSKAYPFPSFNVKDLHTVDDGVIRELFPALHRDDWDVLIGHFLGVDHVGHTFDVESPRMGEKLRQYNDVIERVVTLLRNMSEPGGLHEDTLLIVMGDHGQTLDGDHGGGTPEEVETALFALSMNRRSGGCLSKALVSSCDVEDPVIGCISSIPQLDFSATLATFLGVPFPFGSVGQVNAELFDLVARDPEPSPMDLPGDSDSSLCTLRMLERYKEILCINSWQVRRYFEAYTAVAITGLPKQDLERLETLYSTAHALHETHLCNGCHLSSVTDVEVEATITRRMIDEIKERVEAYRAYLSAAASLARSQWTQFGIEWMVIGLLLLPASIAVRAVALYRLAQNVQERWEVGLLPVKPLLVNSIGSSYPVVMLLVLHPLFHGTPFYSALMYIQKNVSSVILSVTIAASVVAYMTASPRSFSGKKFRFWTGGSRKSRKFPTVKQVDPRSVVAALFVILHALSLFSNSYIVAEGAVINFLMASSGMIYLRYAIKARSKIFQALCYLGFIWILPRVHSLALFKGLKAVEGSGFFSSALNSANSSKMLLLQLVLTITTVGFPLVALTWLIRWKLSKSQLSVGRLWRSVQTGTAVSYLLITVYWVMMDLSSSGLVSVPDVVMRFVRLDIPRTIYFITCAVISAATAREIHNWRVLGSKCTCAAELLLRSGTVIVAGFSGSLMILMGRRGPLMLMLVAVEVWCFLELQSLTSCGKSRELTSPDKGRKQPERIVPSFGPSADWGLIASQVFFSTGHSCDFNGLHFSAAFVGFDEFGFYQQGILLAVETFGASHMLPIFGLPILVLWGLRLTRSSARADDKDVVLQVTKGYLWFSLVQAIITTITTASVCIQRRHLMVWRIFAPKFVFDSVGLLLVDVLVILATSSFFFFSEQKQHSS